MQLSQVVGTEAPSAEEYLPASHATQELSDEAPTAEEYLPAPQFSQALATVAAVVVRYLPAPHATHEEGPVTILYFPSAHAVQLTPFGPVYPGLHRQLVESVEPLGD